MQTVALWVLNPEDGSFRCPLPDVASWALSPLFCDAGAVQFTYPAGGVNFDVLREHIDHDRDIEIAVWVDGQPRPNLTALVNEFDGDDVDPAAVWSFTGTFLPGRLSEAIVVPHENMGPPVELEPGQTAQDVYDAKFYSETAGAILGTLMAEAHDRDTLADIDTSSFTSTTDSGGTPWSKVITLKFAPGVNYLEVILALVSYGLCEFDFDYKRLRLFEPGTLAMDHTIASPPLVFRHGRDVTDSPRKHSLRDTATSLLVAGDEGLYYTADDPTAQARRGRRIETYQSQGSLNDAGALAAYGQTQLERLTPGKMEKTHGLAFADDNPQPLRDFNVGDWAYTDVGAGLERLRIKQWTVESDEHGALSGTVVLNDLFAERDAALARRISGIEGGTTITGLSQARDIPDNLVDNLAPATPEGLVVGSTAYQGRDGNTYALVQATWGEVTRNADQTLLEDLDGYVVRWRYTAPELTTIANGLPVWSPSDTTWQTSTVFSGVLTGVEVAVQVAARDRVGNMSPWSSEVFAITEGDSTPPPVPSTPVCTASLGVVRIVWDGAGAYGEAMPLDFAHTEVHVSATAEFVPDDTTRFDMLVGPGVSVYAADYDAEVFVRLVAVDRAGNASAPSQQGSATATRLVGSDLVDSIITADKIDDFAVNSAKIVDAAIVTAKIDDLAVNDAKIADLSVGKLTAGTLSADVILGARVATSLTGPRMELNNQGLYAWDTSGVNTIQVGSDGDVLIRGVLRTGDSGTRTEFLPARSTRHGLAGINFFANTGTDFASLISGEGNYYAINGRGPVVSMLGPNVNTNHAGMVISDVVGMGITSTRDSTGEKSWTSMWMGNYVSPGRGLWGVANDNVPREQWVAQYTLPTRHYPASGWFGWKKTRHDGVVMWSGLSADRDLHNVENGDVRNVSLFCYEKVNVVNQFGNYFMPIVASKHLVGESEAASKTDIAPVPTSALTALRNAPSQTWRYRGEDADPSQHIGPMANDLPDWLVEDAPKLPDGSTQHGGSKTISLDSMLGALWQAVRELDVEIDEFRVASGAVRPTRKAPRKGDN